MPQKPVFSVHVDDDIKSHPPATPQNVLQFDKVLSSRKPDRPSVMDTLRNKVMFKVYVKVCMIHWIAPAFWLVLTCDLLEDRLVDNNIINNKYNPCPSEPVL